MDGGRVSLVVRDDGKGVETERASRGHGLENMRRRARELGGELQVDSAQGRGTTIRLEVPVRSHRRWGRRRTSPPV